MSRLERMLGAPNPAGRGLEIGALHAPLLRRPGHDVRYVDYAPTEVIRANQFDPAIPVQDIVEVDLVWGRQPLAQLAGGPVDYVAASHVIEHVPDLIGWLTELSQALRPGGVLGLAIPDMRFTFDALRPASTLAQAVEAWLQGARQPSLRQVFEAAALGVSVEAAEAWAGRVTPASRRGEVLQRLPSALALVRELKARPRYNDAHCWTFTPQSFLDLAEELAVLGLFPFRIAAFFPTDPGGGEFFARLQRPESEGAAGVAQSIAAAKASLASAESPPASEAEALRRSLDEIYASTSWRLTAPLRALKTRLGRRPG
jgi:SAM-dependent methyltransferase